MDQKNAEVVELLSSNKTLAAALEKKTSQELELREALEESRQVCRDHLGRIKTLEKNYERQSRLIERLEHVDGRWASFLQQRKDKRALRDSLRAWHGASRRGSRNAVVAENARALRASRSLGVTFRQWSTATRQVVRSKGRREEFARRLLSKWAKTTLGGALHFWWRATVGSAHGKLSLKRVVGVWRNRELSRGFQRWRQLARQHALVFHQDMAESLRFECKALKVQIKLAQQHERGRLLVARMFHRWVASKHVAVSQSDFRNMRTTLSRKRRLVPVMLAWKA